MTTAIKTTVTKLKQSPAAKRIADLIRAAQADPTQWGAFFADVRPNLLAELARLRGVKRIDDADPDIEDEMSAANAGIWRALISGRVDLDNRGLLKLLVRIGTQRAIDEHRKRARSRRLDLRGSDELDRLAW